MYISRDTLDLIRDKTSIVDIIQKYVPSLKKRGKNFIGLCPFHKENTPSFTVSPDKQIFHCFGCHSGGNVFTFISKIEKLDFVESVHFLADKLGIVIKEAVKTDTSATDRAFNLNNFAMKSFSDFFSSPAGKVGREYLAKRGVTEEGAMKFHLGFAPESWEFMVNTLRRNNTDLELAVQYGIISSTVKEGKKRFFDRFRDRIMFPIFDANDRVVGFGGRIIGKGEPKYLNSPETELFKKRYILYGFNLAREHIRDLNRAIIVEGYLDVIGCHQKGLQNVVAPLGTALTEEQLAVLARYCTEIILIFDADSAGESASLRSLEKAGSINANLRVGILPEGDPFDFIQKFGEREFMTVVDSAMNPVDYQLSRIAAGLNKKGRIVTLLESFAVIKNVLFETERNVYIKKIGALLNIDENIVRKDFNSFLHGMKPSETERIKANVKKDQDFFTRSYKDLVKLLCNHPELIQKASIDFSEDTIQDPIIKKIFAQMVRLYSADDSFSIDKMFDFFPNGLEMDFLNDCLNSHYTFEDPDAVYTEIYINMKIHEIDDKINSCVTYVKAHKDNKDEFLAEVEVLKREKEKLQNYLQNRKI